jgi:hypothetical protein
MPLLLPSDLYRTITSLVTTSDLSVAEKIYRAIDAISTCESFTIIKPPYIERDVLFSYISAIARYAEEKHQKTITIASFGIGDGVRVYLVSTILAALGIDTRIVGYEYDDRSIAQSSTLFSDAIFYTRDIIALTPDDSSITNHIHQVDVVDASFIIHELTTFSDHEQFTSLYTPQLTAYKRFLVLASSLLRTDGILWINDGHIMDDAQKQYTVTLSPPYQAAYDLLQKRYQLVKLPCISADGRVTLTRQEFGVAIDKMTFFLDFRRKPVNTDRIEREMAEVISYAKREDFVQTLTTFGYTIDTIQPYDNEAYHGKTCENTTCEDPTFYSMYPNLYVFIIARKSASSDNP